MNYAGKEDISNINWNTKSNSWGGVGVLEFTVPAAEAKRIKSATLTEMCIRDSANPVDILTQVAIKLSGLPENRVIGSGTVLDSARLRYKLGEHLSVDSRSVHAFILGEHGDSEVVAWSSANVSGVPLSEMCEMRGHYKHKENTEEIATAVKNSAYEIINKKHATYYGIAMSVKRDVYKRQLYMRMSVSLRLPTYFSKNSR